jgi:hypothetical protein
MNDDAVTWRPYSVLLIDIMGFSRSVTDAARRDALVRTYRDVVDSLYDSGLNVEIVRLVRRFELGQRVASGMNPNDAAHCNQEEEASDATAWRQRVAVFSDSMFFFFDGEPPGSPSPTSLKFLGLRAAQISQGLWTSRVPHRGAIAHGECCLDPRRSIFLGEAIVKAAEWEKSQEWLGISVEPGSLNRLQALLRTENHCLKPHDVPTKAASMATLSVDIHNAIVRGVERTGQPTPTDEAIDGFVECFQQARRERDDRVTRKYGATAQRFIALGIKHPELRRIAQGNK